MHLFPRINQENRAGSVLSRFSIRFICVFQVCWLEFSRKCKVMSSQRCYGLNVFLFHCCCSTIRRSARPYLSSTRNRRQKQLREKEIRQNKLCAEKLRHASDQDRYTGWSEQEKKSFSGGENLLLSATLKHGGGRRKFFFLSPKSCLSSWVDPPSSRQRES